MPRSRTCITRQRTAPRPTVPCEACGACAARQGPARAPQMSRNAGRATATGRLDLQRASVVAFVVLAVRARADRLPPPLVLAIPRNRPRQPLLKPHPRPPPKPTQLLRRQRIPAVMPRTVGHELDQPLIPPSQLDDLAGPPSSCRTHPDRRSCKPRPGTPWSSACPIPRAKSSTNNQFRTFFPSPYTGNRSPANAFRIISGISFSGY